MEILSIRNILIIIKPTGVQSFGFIRRISFYLICTYGKSRIPKTFQIKEIKSLLRRKRPLRKNPLPKAHLFQPSSLQKIFQRIKKKAIVQECAIDLLEKASSAKDPIQQKKNTEAMTAVIKDTLGDLLQNSKSAASEIFKLAHVNPKFDHAVNVATYSVLFGMAFGRINHELLNDLGLAGLLHDIGLSQIPVRISVELMAENSVNTDHFYSDHVDLGLKLLDHLDYPISDRIRELILQHHERFDGSGYPDGRMEFEFDDIAQLIAFADLLDTFISGKWDGSPKTFSEAANAIALINEDPEQHSFFDQEIINTVLKWIGSGTELSASESANVVKEKLSRILKTG